MSWHWKIIKSSPSRGWKSIPEQQVLRSASAKKKKKKRWFLYGLGKRRGGEALVRWVGRGWGSGGVAGAARGLPFDQGSQWPLSSGGERWGGETAQHRKPRWQLWDGREEHCMEKPHHHREP